MDSAIHIPAVPGRRAPPRLHALQQARSEDHVRDPETVSTRTRSPGCEPNSVTAVCPSLELAPAARPVADDDRPEHGDQRGRGDCLSVPMAMVRPVLLA